MILFEIKRKVTEKPQYLISTIQKISNNDSKKGQKSYGFRNKKKADIKFSQ